MADFLLIIAAAYLGARLADRFPSQTWRGYRQDIKDWLAERAEKKEAARD